MPLPSIEVNGRHHPAADRTVVVVCVDGSEPEYHQQAVAAGLMPCIARMTSHPATCAMPSLTNPNNVSIATGVPPAVHGISGNYFYDRETGKEVMMNDPRWLRAPTLFAEYSRHGARVAVVTAKDKLRRLLGSGLSGGVCFSAERAEHTTHAEHGIDDALDLVGLPQPPVYSADLSEFTLAAGVALVQTERPDLVYLSLTDYVQHQHAPGTDAANAFYAMLDRYCDQLDRLGCALVVTADHGMNAKATADGRPRVVYLGEHLESWLDTGTARVVLPITDPYTAHHGALGSFASIYLPDPDRTTELLARLADLPGIEAVLDNATAADRFALPADRLGDLVVIGDHQTALGATPEHHDLTQLEAPLRSHGGLAEQTVPFLANGPIDVDALDGGLHNYDAFWMATRLANTAHRYGAASSETTTSAT